MSSDLNKRAGVVKMLRELVSALCENVDNLNVVKISSDCFMRIWKIESRCSELCEKMSSDCITVQWFIRNEQWFQKIIIGGR